jgi:hypothetical protein
MCWYRLQIKWGLQNKTKKMKNSSYKTVTFKSLWIIGVWQWCNRDTASHISQNICRTSVSLKPNCNLKKEIRPMFKLRWSKTNWYRTYIFSKLILCDLVCYFIPHTNPFLLRLLYYRYCTPREKLLYPLHSVKYSQSWILFQTKFHTLTKPLLYVTCK